MAADTVARLQAALDETEAVLAVPFEQLDPGYRTTPDRERRNLSVTSLGVWGYEPAAGVAVSPTTVLDQIVALWNSLGFKTKVTQVGDITEVTGEIPDEGVIELGVTNSAIALSAVTQLIEN